ncbi:hypothetical protein [Parachitinimonas caeni]|uniref:Flagellar hook-length control protein FliK n=1 Tax=Parachitinimonas caeni TaxID=3031301 RepID=A0ABT7DYI9_9NEIS|nr:hypothetical protein [Parachitinimonas caeni]MDK2125128.1 hypothetical protein [Parachitinimonas caeni]
MKVGSSVDSQMAPGSAGQANFLTQNWMRELERAHLALFAQMLDAGKADAATPRQDTRDGTPQYAEERRHRDASSEPAIVDKALTGHPVTAVEDMQTRSTLQTGEAPLSKSVIDTIGPATNTPQYSGRDGLTNRVAASPAGLLAEPESDMASSIGASTALTAGNDSMAPAFVPSDVGTGEVEIPFVWAQASTSAPPMMSSSSVASLAAARVASIEGMAYGSGLPHMVSVQRYAEPTGFGALTFSAEQVIKDETGSSEEADLSSYARRSQLTEEWDKRVIHVMQKEGEAKVTIRDSTLDVLAQQRILLQMASQFANDGLRLHSLTLNGREMRNVDSDAAPEQGREEKAKSGASSGLLGSDLKLGRYF